MKYITVREAAAKWGISERRIQKLCQDNRIKGQARFGRDWMIPAKAEKPGDPRLTTNLSTEKEKRTDIMTVKEAAAKWEITPRRVNEIIRDGRIKGVYKVGATWVMPADTEKPIGKASTRLQNKGELPKSPKAGGKING